MGSLKMSRLSCIWCDSKNLKRFLEYPEIDVRLYKCRDCKTLSSGCIDGGIDYTSYNKDRVVAEYRETKRDEEMLSTFYSNEDQGRYLLSRVNRVIEGREADALTFLDIGAGPGVLLSLIKKKCPEALVWGVDPSVYNVSVARNQYGIELIQGFWEGQVDKQFDVISIFGSLMLHPDPKRSLRMAIEKLKDGGTIIFDFKNPENWGRQFLANANAFLRDSVVKRRIYKQAFHGMPTGLQVKEVTRFLEEQRLQVIEVNQISSRNEAIGSKKGILFRGSALMNKVTGVYPWVEVIARRPNVESDRSEKST